MYIPDPRGRHMSKKELLNELMDGQMDGRRRRRNILHVSARQHVRSHAAGPNDPASHHQFATIAFVCGHPRHNAQSMSG